MVNPLGGSGGVSQLVALHTQKIAESKPTETGPVPGFLSPEKIKEQATTAQKTGGVLSDHSVALQKLADDKQICICIRGVNPLATGLIESGFGTKDMSIKAKSSNLPPLNGLIPFDQQYGKKGFDKDAVDTFNDKNHHALHDKVATKVNAEIPVAQIKMLAQVTGNLEIRGGFLDTDGGSGVMIGTDFKTKDNPGGKQFPFWGERHGDTVKIFKAELQENGTYAKGDPIEVMANREGKPVTADYDLALVAPRMQDYGPEHTSDLKTTTFREFKQQNPGIEDRMRSALLKLVDKFNETGDPKIFNEAKALVGDAKLLAGFPMLDMETLGKAVTAAVEKSFMDGVNQALDKSSVEYGGLTQDQVRSAVQEEVLLKLAAELGQDAVFDLVGEPDLLAAYCDHYAQTNHDDLVKRGVLPENPSVSRGVTSSFVNDLLPELNGVCGREKGTEVFHHGADTGNPFSVEADNFPMTVILPREAAGPGGEVIRVVNDATSFTKLVKDLKDKGFQTPLNALWDKDPTLATTRSERFESARKTLENLFGGGGSTVKTDEPENLSMLAKRQMFENFQKQPV